MIVVKRAPAHLITVMEKQGANSVRLKNIKIHDTHSTSGRKWRQGMSLTEEDKQWLKENCGKVERAVLYIMVFFIFIKICC